MCRHHCHVIIIIIIIIINALLPLSSHEYLATYEYVLLAREYFINNNVTYKSLSAGYSRAPVYVSYYYY